MCSYFDIQQFFYLVIDRHTSVFGSITTTFVFCVKVTSTLVVSEGGAPIATIVAAAQCLPILSHPPALPYVAALPGSLGVDLRRASGVPVTCREVSTASQASALTYPLYAPALSVARCLCRASWFPTGWGNDASFTTTLRRNGAAQPAPTTTRQRDNLRGDVQIMSWKIQGENEVSVCACWCFFISQPPSPHTLFFFSCYLLPPGFWLAISSRTQRQQLLKRGASPRVKGFDGGGGGDGSGSRSSFSSHRVPEVPHQLWCHRLNWVLTH